MGQINDLVKDIHKNAVDHGWWSNNRNDSECIALMHCELSEAIEELRKGKEPHEVYENEDKPGKLEGVPIELLDCVIRVFDYLGSLSSKVDVENLLISKHEYNKKRPHKHGKKF